MAFPESPRPMFLIFAIIFIALSTNHVISATYAQLKPRWTQARVISGGLSRRHEACAVMVNGLVVLIGGRRFNQPVNIYNPKTLKWFRHPGAGPYIELHHFQCVAAQGKVWIVSSWTGPFPKELNTDKIYVYDVASHIWSTRNAMPEWRRRGGAAAVRRGNWIYVVGGNRGGHGAHSTSLSWMDAYNFRTNKWALNLPSMPAEAARDHVGAGLVKGKLCVAGGRDGGLNDISMAAKPSTYCFNFGTYKWKRYADMPEPRAGAATGTMFTGSLMVAGGEGTRKAFKSVHMFDGFKWTKGPNLIRGRHGSGVAIAQPRCGQMFIPSGSGAQGGGPELTTTEKYVPPNVGEICGWY